MRFKGIYVNLNILYPLYSIWYRYRCSVFQILHFYVSHTDIWIPVIEKKYFCNFLLTVIFGCQRIAYLFTFLGLYCLKVYIGLVPVMTFLIKLIFLFGQYLSANNSETYFQIYLFSVLPCTHYSTLLCRPVCRPILTKGPVSQTLSPSVYT